MESLLQIAIIDIRILDVFDILIVAYLMYRIYQVLKGSIAFNIFIGVVLLYLVYFLVEALQMSLLSLLLGKFVGFGVLILIIIFQPEIRKFLLALGHSTLKGRMNVLNKWFNPISETEEAAKNELISKLESAILIMSKSKTGSLIVIDNNDILQEYTITGISINANISSQLIQNIFFKNSPLHDGAVIINNNKIIAASCILPISNRTDIASHLGLRHRAAIGITENNAVTALLVSEETGMISISNNGNIIHIKEKKDLKKTLSKYI